MQFIFSRIPSRLQQAYTKLLLLFNRSLTETLDPNCMTRKCAANVSHEKKCGLSLYMLAHTCFPGSIGGPLETRYIRKLVYGDHTGISATVDDPGRIVVYIVRDAGKI
jgi:hypothetical protein